MNGPTGDLLNVSDLRVVFHSYRGIIRALNGVDLWLSKGQRLALVGESGCGKSVTSLSLMRLIEQPGEITSGSILFNGQDLMTISEEKMDEIRGNEMTIIFQEPLASLNPVFKVGFQVEENLHKNRPIERGGAMRYEIEKMLYFVGLDAKRVVNLYPHQLSGGMAQRVMIAIALSSNPKLLIADEPTSALDVTIQVQLLELLMDLIKKLNSSVIIVTHDMGIAAEFCDRIAVMYAGNTVEYSTTPALFENPLHPYSNGLLKAILHIGGKKEINTIKGEVPDLLAPPVGCRFHPRCPYAMPKCLITPPPMTQIEKNHFVACYLYEQVSELR